ncbi:MAG: beta-1,3-glucanase [uncultured bacterium]|nr:MAG: beta-1,3-glucanase [uncultured bacterium]
MFRRFFSRVSALLLVVLLSLASLTTVWAATDTKAPGYVENVKAVPADGEVQLRWDAATDNVGVTGYKIYMGLHSVSKAGDKYDLDPIEVGNVLKTTVEDLDNNTTYYFAMTALDAAGNESEAYSYEVSATLVDSGDDGKNPVVSSAKALDCENIEVHFSEDVVFSSEDPMSAFKIEDLDTMQYLKVLDVSYQEDNHSIVILKTEAMNEKAQYLMTVGVDVQDDYGNAIVSGTSDTAVFSGASCEVQVVTPPDDEEPKDEEAPVVEEVTIVDATTLEIGFNEEVVLLDVEEDAAAREQAAGEETEDESLASEEENTDQIVLSKEDENPVLNYFEIYTKDNQVLEVESVEYKDTGEKDEDGEPVFDRKVLVIKTVTPHVGETEYFVSITGLTDEAGNAMMGDTTSSSSYTTPKFETEEIPDTVAPEDVTNLVADAVDKLVNLSWVASLNSAGDLVDQLFYVSKDGGQTYEAATSLGKDPVTYSFSGGVEGQTYTFKITTKDGTGNESQGAIVTATLPTTGAGIGLLAAASVFGGSFLGKKKKK